MIGGLYLQDFAELSGGFDPSVLSPQIVFDDAGLGLASWVPTINVTAITHMTPFYGPSITSNWLGTGKPILNSPGSGNWQATSSAGFTLTARTWFVLGEFPASFSATEAFVTNYPDSGASFPMYMTGPGTTLGTDWLNGSNNRALISGLSGLAGKPFVYAVSAIATNDFRGHLLCNGLSLAGVNTTSVASLNSTYTSLKLGGWLGAVMGSKCASWGGFGIPATAAQLLGLTEYWASKYGRANF